ncbi:MAG TPA: hypothetical protein VFK05_37890, partial [Polyangiaceae bacterium]|nr:hypothetical protein [Polyangiaceae bacterium]
MMHARIRWAIALLPSLGLVCGCSSSPTLTHTEPEPAPPSFSPAQPIPPTSGVGAPLFGGQNLRAEHTAPVAGGTLAVTRDDSTIVVADPDRDAVFLVDSASRVVRTVSLSRGDEPGRIAEGSNGALFVALRGAGAVVEIDVHGATVLRRSAVCASPRGVAYEAKTESLHVACRSGQLLSLDTQTLRPKRTLQLDPDLRDVIVRDRDLLVTRFLNAEVLLIAEDGSVSRRASPPSECGDASVLYRALSLPGGQVALAHQVSSNDIVGEGPGGYGSGSSCVVGLVSRWLTVVDPETPSGSEPDASLQGLDPEGLVVHSPMTFHSTFLPGAGPLDVAFDARGTRVASIAFDEQLPALTLSRPIIALAPRATNPVATLWVSSWDASAGQFGDPSDFTSVVLPGQPVAVAFSAAGQYIVQSREPATLQFEDGTSVRLSDESHEDSGHRMFHMDSGIGIACASCHPEGGDDGHVWHFPEG